MYIHDEHRLHDLTGATLTPRTASRLGRMVKRPAR